MADISDERLEELVHWSSNDGYGGMPDTHKALLELQRHRATMQSALEYGDLTVAHMETLLSYVTNGLSPARELLPEIRSLVAEILRHREGRMR